MADFLTEAFLRIRERVIGKAAGEDALQEAFVKLWGRYSPHSSGEADALLKRTMRNVAIDARRRKKTVSPRGRFFRVGRRAGGTPGAGAGKGVSFHQYRGIASQRYYRHSKIYNPTA